ncbi:MAG: hypothetical protein JXA91_03985 [Candidatus Thermoplasmatota archaeon]|nr:hypothetical protein [Candidatus Thermoplasmatota archaeon]
MKKFCMLFGAVAISTLIISSVSAVPQTHSEPIIQIVNEIEKNRAVLEDKYLISIEDAKTSLSEILPLGILDTIIQLLVFLINLIYGIVNFLLTIMQLASLITLLLNAITVLIDTVSQFIEWLMNLFNPQTQALTS